MPLRLSLAEAKDREFLEKHGVDLKKLYQEQNRRMVNIEVPSEKRSNAVKNVGNMRKRFTSHRFEKDGVKWASKYEYETWLVLKELEERKTIENLKRQIPVKFIYNNIVIWRAIPDYYFETQVDENHTEPIYADAKSSYTSNTREFKTTQKMFTAFYGRPMLVFCLDERTNIQQAIKSYPL